jgi:hypothetical protein
MPRFRERTQKAVESAKGTVAASVNETLSVI